MAGRQAATAAAAGLCFLLLVAAADAIFQSVTPNPTELAAMCGPYTVPTPTFNCVSFNNATGYGSGCTGAPFSCTCLPEAPYSFQPQPVFIPCLYNYQVQQCTGLSEAKYFCGVGGVSCTKRCNVAGNCYAANVCECVPGSTMPTNPQYCGYPYQADYCLVPPQNPVNTRPITTCGVYATQAYYLCPNSTSNYDPNLCHGGCNCQPGTGRTPGSAVDCDGVDRPCNSGDVLGGCGPQYASCTKRCQYTNSAPTVQSACVVLPGSCVLSNSTAAVSGYFACPANQIATLCGPATQSCVQYKLTGAVVNTTCTCTSNGVASFSGTIPCDAWEYYLPAPYSLCQSTCGAPPLVPGFINGTTYPCQYRRYITPTPTLLPLPGFNNYSRQANWLTQGYNNRGLVIWNPLTLSWEDEPIAIVRAAGLSVQGGYNTYFTFLQCDCDSAPIKAAAQLFGVLDSILPAGNIDTMLISGGPGYLNLNNLYTQYPDGSGNYIAKPIVLSLGGLRDTYKLYPSFSGGGAPQPIGNFYQVLSCQGPVIAATAAIAKNDKGGYGNTPAAVVDSIDVDGPDAFTLCSGQTCQVGCAPLSPSITASFGTTWQLVETLSPFTNAANWIVTYASTSLPNNLYAFACPNVNGYPATFGLYRSGMFIDSIVEPGNSYKLIPYSNAEFVFGNPWFAQRVCSGFGVILPYNQSPGDIEDAWAFMGSELIDEKAPYLRPTLLANSTVYQVMPMSQYGIAQAGISKTAYGPIGLNQYIAPICACTTVGWGGPICGSNALCAQCIFVEGNSGGLSCRELGITVPAGYQACLNAVPANGFQVNQNFPNINHFAFDLYYNGRFGSGTIMESSCPLNDGTAAPVECDRLKYNRLVSQFCANGVASYNQGGLTCVCNPGWVKLDSSGMMGCTIANGGNCPITSSYCNSFGYQARPSNCTCGGHGLISPETGRCICDVDWVDNGQGCCSIPNTCQSCINVTGTHIIGCNKTATGAINICSSATSSGSWTGPCCNVFTATAPCIHGTFQNGQGEYVYRYNTTSNALVPVVFRGSSVPGYNPNGAFCNCDGGFNTWTGVSCNQSPCPTYNGVVCNGRGNCINGQCMQSGACADPAYTGCGCQLNLQQSCQGGLGLPLCSQRGTCGAAPSQNLTLQCTCSQGYGGTYCGTSACGPSDCNANEQAGVCVFNSTTSSYSCSCYQSDPNICDSNFGCVWAGPQCEIDVTTQCAYVYNGRADMCNLHGYCNVTDPSPTKYGCVCSDGWITSGNRCTTQPCSPQCGPNGNCVIKNGSPVCECKPNWSPFNGAAPCSTNGCKFGIPNNITGACQCNNTAFSYSTNCTQLSCNSFNGVSCGQVNCAIQLTCRENGACRPGCSSGGSNICTNGTCTCHWSSMYDPVLKYCVSRCAPWPATSRINSNIIGGQPVFAGCDCALGANLDPASGCYTPLCRNGGTLDPISFQCVCKPGWRGPTCQDTYCSGHGIFNNGTSNDCTCFFPWTGPTCQQNLCGAHGFPVVDPQRAPDGRCECQLAYIGMTCEFDQCAPHGRASTDGNSCICDSGWAGVHCQVFGCYQPNIVYNNTCSCAPNYYGPACQFLQCGPAGVYTNGTCSYNATETHCIGGFSNGTCACGGVSLLRNGNCTGNTCGAFGLPTTNLGSCICNPNAVFRPQLDSNHSFNCVPNCQNGGVYNNTVPIGCNCPAGTSQPICILTPISSSSTAGSSTGHSSSSSTGSGPINAVNPAAAPSLLLLLLLLTITAALLPQASP